MNFDFDCFSRSVMKQLFKWRSLSCRNQCINLLCKSMEWFLYDIVNNNNWSETLDKNRNFTCCPVAEICGNSAETLRLYKISAPEN